ncbi:MAG: hypothetical protein OQK75_10715 [Gammaproteobacteria bacterium]|nr:hypothetical protein [Gammaproteobacteria bacterium]MCW9030513.1 hypothetical protein [Gammaproteobacteria bacterium]
MHSAKKGSSLFVSSLKLKENQYTFYAKKSFKVFDTRYNKEVVSVHSGRKFKAILKPYKFKGKSYYAVCLANCRAKRYIVGLVTPQGKLYSKLYSVIARNQKIEYEAKTLKVSSNNVRFKANVKTSVKTLPDASQTLDYVGDNRAIPTLELTQHTNSEGKHDGGSIVLYTINARKGIKYPCGDKCVFKVVSKSADTIRFKVFKSK